MELSWALIFKLIACLAGIVIATSLISSLTWLNKIRLVATFAIGFLFVGLLAWPLVKPIEPFTPVCLPANSINMVDIIILAVLAFIAGFAAFFTAWPHGRQMAILAVPAGLSLIAVRQGDMAHLIHSGSTPPQRQEILATLRFEPLLWLAIVAMGLLGVIIAQKITSQDKKAVDTTTDDKTKTENKSLNYAIALVASFIIIQFGIKLFARDVNNNSAAAQSTTAQIVFALLVSFAIAAFVTKKLLNAGFIWPIIAGILVTTVATTTYARQDVMQRFYQNLPFVFFPSAANTILPIQIVALGTLGAVAGHWIAVRYDCWRKHESQQ